MKRAASIAVPVERTMTKVLDHGHVNLVDFMGGDHRVDQAAGASLNKFDRYRKIEDVERIINYMMKHRHGTPFEHSVFTFQVKAPIFVAREWMRHRIGSYNEVSLRYTEIEPEFYVPEYWRSQDPKNKQGSVPTGANPTATLNVVSANESAKQHYKLLLENGVARELARLVLPVNVYTEFMWTVNARSLMNFLSLRLDSGAQYEIRVYALTILTIFRDKMPITAEAFVENSYIAP